MNGEDGVYNMKFISDCGKYEAVYNKEGVLLTEDNDPVNMGTYNYVNFMDDRDGHTKFDVEHYLILGNISDVLGFRAILITEYMFNAEAVSYRKEMESLLDNNTTIEKKQDMYREIHKKYHD